MTISKKEIYEVTLNAGVTLSVTKINEDHLPAASFSLGYEWANGERGADLDDLTLSLDDLRNLGYLINRVTDYRENGGN